MAETMSIPAISPPLPPVQSKPAEDAPVEVISSSPLIIDNGSPVVPTAPISPSRRTRHPTLPASPISPRLSQRSRKPSAKAMENAEAGPSSAGIKVEEPPEPPFLQPDHFCALNNGAKPPTSSKTRWEAYSADTNFLSPEDDPLALRGIPVFRPTIEEFQDFEAYVTRTVPWGMRSGITKVIPPAEWVAALPPMDARTLSKVQIKSPIQQNMMGTAGIFRATNIEKNKSRPLSVREWFDKCQDDKFAGPPPKSYERDSNEARLARQEAAREKRERDEKRKEERKRKREEKSKRAEDDVKLEADVPGLDAPTSGSEHSSPDPIAKTPELDPVDPWYQDTDFKSAWLPKNTTPEDYTTEACAKLQEKYWKTMGLGEPSWYGADLMQGSLFADAKTPWNVAHLPNLLDRINCVVPGVNEPYLYFGMWRATFAWHVEDMDLFSINYIHFGAPKFWYAIPQGQADQLERFLAHEFPLDASSCDQFIRHKSMAISPTRLKEAGIRVNMLTHHQGEFVITYPKGYHAGFNMGFNCAESVNFALDSWIEYGRKAKHCRCVSHSVRIDVDKMLAEAADAVHQAPGVKAAKRHMPLKPEDESQDDTPRSKKRPRKSKAVKDEAGAAEEGAYRGTDASQIIQLEENVGDVDMADASVVQDKGARKRPKSRVSLVTKDKPVYPCVFCPSTSTDDLARVSDPNELVMSHWRGKEGPVTAHIQCAQATPECGFEDRMEDGTEVTYVTGANEVVKDRWKLKCKTCETKQLAMCGVKVQCTKGKCPQAFHYSCALADTRVKAALWQVDEWVPKTPSPEAAEASPELTKISYLKLELLCPQHNPEQIERREREKAEETKVKILELVPGEMIKIKAGSSSMHQKLISIDEANKMVEVELAPGNNTFVPWNKVDFRTNAPRVVPNEYARVHTHARNADGVSQPVQAPAAAPDTVTQPRLQAPIVAKAKPVKKVHPPPLPATSVQANRSYGAQSSGALPSVLAPPHPAQHYNAPPSYRTFPTAQAGYPASHAYPYPSPQYHPVQAYPPDATMRQIYHPQPQPHLPNRVYCVSGRDSYGPQYGYHGYARPQHHQGHAHHGQYSAQAYYAPIPDQRPPYYTHNDPRLPPGYMYAQAPPLASSYHSYPPPPGSYNGTPVGHPMSSADARGTVEHRTHLPASAAHHPTPTHQMSSGPRGMSHLMNPSPSSEGQTIAPSGSRGTADIPMGGNTGIGKIDLGLDRMQRLLAAFPPLTIPAVHLAGTNGKGSVSALLDSCLSQAGLRTARYNSPHLLEPRDAVRIAGRPISREQYQTAVSAVTTKANQLGLQATTFEIATAAAYLVFNQEKVDVMIIECGMGGARDATNVIPDNLVLATALTSIGLDHVAFLGGTIEAIASEKAHIAKRGGMMIAAKQAPGVESVIHRVATQIGSEFSLVQQPCREVGQTPLTGPFSGLRKRMVTVPFFGESLASGVAFPLQGDHQLDNLSLAVAILDYIRANSRTLSIQPKLAQVTPEAVKAGIENVKWAGRCSWLPTHPSRPNPILVDGAHNADSADVLRRYIDSLQLGSTPLTFVMALSESKGKSTESVLLPLLRQGDGIAVVKFSTPVEGMPWIKPVPAAAVAEVAGQIVGQGNVWLGPEGKETGGSEGGKGDMRERLDDALKWAQGRGGLTVVCGSLYLVADVYRLFGMEGEV